MSDQLNDDDILMCAYEVARLNQIKQNKDFLASLGLEKVSATVQVRTDPVPSVKKKRNKKRLNSTPADMPAPKRRSARLVSQQRPNVLENVEKERKETERLEKYKLLISLQNKHGGAKLPPNASYAHTVDRVLSMSEKALEARIKKIERANGKYALLKQRMFAEVLIIEGYTELAKLAQESVMRLRRAKE